MWHVVGDGWCHWHICWGNPWNICYVGWKALQLNMYIKFPVVPDCAAATEWTTTLWLKHIIKWIRESQPWHYCGQLRVIHITTTCIQNTYSISKSTWSSTVRPFSSGWKGFFHYYMVTLTPWRTTTSKKPFGFNLEALTAGENCMKNFQLLSNLLYKN